MNLIDIKRLKKKLKLEKYMCYVLAFLFTIGANGNSNRKDINNVNPLKNIEFINPDDFSLINIAYASDLEEMKCVNTENIELIEDQKADVIEISNEIESISDVKVDTYEEESDVIKETLSLYNSYVEPTYEEKMIAIMEDYGYTYGQLDMSLAGAVAESCNGGESYDEGRNTMSTLYNRTHAGVYVYDTAGKFGEGTGYSVYYQFIAPEQFSVYANGSYKQYLGRIDLPAYQGAIDVLYYKAPTHDYLEFNNEPPQNKKYEQLTENGNYYSRHIKNDNLINDSLVRERIIRNNR